MAMVKTIAARLAIKQRSPSRGHHQAEHQAAVRYFIITFDAYVFLNIFENYDNKRPDPICLTHKKFGDVKKEQTTGLGQKRSLVSDRYQAISMAALQHYQKL